MRGVLLGFNQRNRTNQRYVRRGLLQGISLNNCEDYVGKLEMCRVGRQKRQGGILRHELMLESTGKISFSRKPQLCS